jgi:hypothetical protein
LLLLTAVKRYCAVILFTIKLKKTVYILFSILLIGCGDYASDYVRFKTAQPDGVKTSDSFGRKVKGEYNNYSNPNNRLIISDNLILNAQTVHIKIHRDDLEFDSTISIDKNVDDQLTYFLKSKGYGIEITNDTINAFQTFFDTLFNISKNQILKKFKGSYFINFKVDENSWKVQRFNLQKDTLLIGQITPSDTLLRFNFIVKNEELNESDSSTINEYFIHSSKKEFKKLLKPNSFEETECYYKVK